MEYPDSFPVERYILNAEMDCYKRHLDSARRHIDTAFKTADRWYVAWSGGKDSTALAHIVNSMYPGTEIWSEKDDCDFPGEIEYVTSVAAKYNFNLNLCVPGMPLLDEALARQIDICEDIHSRGTEFSDRFFYSAVAAQESLCDGVFLGLRAEESRARQKNAMMRGHIYRRKNKKWTCCPLVWWTATDVFSYLVTNNIPILNIYFKTKFIGSPENIRKAWMLPGASSRKGFCAWLRYYYPQQFQKLALAFPNIKSYT